MERKDSHKKALRSLSQYYDEEDVESSFSSPRSDESYYYEDEGYKGIHLKRNSSMI
jgi:hypothetical protein